LPPCGKAKRVADEIKAAHPASAILQDPLQDEARRNRRALLAVASICLAARFTGTFPQQISALGISFSGVHERHIIWVAIVVQIYLAIVFALAALADFTLWRHGLRREVREYFESDQGRNARIFTVGSAVSAAVDELSNRGIRIEAPDHRINHELQKYMTKKQSLYRMLLNTYPSSVAYHVMVFLFPVLLASLSVAGLLFWTPHAAASTGGLPPSSVIAFTWPDPISLAADVITIVGLPLLVVGAIKLFRDLRKDRVEEIRQKIEASHREIVSQGCVEFYDTGSGAAINLVPFETRASLPRPGDFVMLPGETHDGQSFGAGEYEVEKVSFSFQEAPEITDQPCPAVPSKIIVYVHRRARHT
jgi:hypothetical protein